MRVLAVTNMYPVPNKPAFGIYVEQQIKGLKRIGLDVEVLFFDRRNKGMRIYLNLKRPLKKKIADFKPEIVHVMYGGIMADLITLIVRDRPTIVTFHGSDLLGQHLSGNVREVIAQWGVWASRRAAIRATGVVAVAAGLQDSLPATVDKSKVRVIPCGIDLERFMPFDRPSARNKLGWERDRFHVLFSTNYADPVKRPELARAAVDALNQMGIKTEMHQLYGVSNEQVPIWLNASDVLLITSRHEGSPTIVKEALACDLPVVSVDVGDVRAQLRDIEGCYIALAHPDDLAKKLALVHGGKRTVAGRQSVQMMSVENIALKLRHFYQETISSFQNKPRFTLPYRVTGADSP